MPVLGSEVVVADPRTASQPQWWPTRRRRRSPPPRNPACRGPRRSRRRVRSVRVRRLRAPAEASLAIDPGAASAGRQVWRVTIPSQQPVRRLRGARRRAGRLDREQPGRDGPRAGSARVFLAEPGHHQRRRSTAWPTTRTATSALLTSLRTKVDPAAPAQELAAAWRAPSSAALRGFDNPSARSARRLGRLTRADETFEAAQRLLPRGRQDARPTYGPSASTKGIGYKRMPLRTNAIPEDNSGLLVLHPRHHLRHAVASMTARTATSSSTSTATRSRTPRSPSSARIPKAGRWARASATTWRP